MGKIITITGLEKNIGKTSFALILSKYFADKFKEKQTLLVDLDIENPEVHKIMAKGELSVFNLDNVMAYALADSNLKSVINSNVEHLNKCKLEILMNATSNTQLKYSSFQYVNLLKSLEIGYDLSVLDVDYESINQEIIDYSDFIICMLTPSRIQVLNSKTYDKFKIFDNGKTFVVLNKSNKGQNDKELENIINRKIDFKLPYDISIINALNSGNININESKYQQAVNVIGKMLYKKIGYKEIKKFEVPKFLRKGER